MRPAESVCMNSFVGVNSLNSGTCHPSMHAPSLARVFDGESGRVSGMDCREGVGGGSRGRDTARSDALLHDVIHFVPVRGNPRVQRLHEYHDCSCARWSASSNSRPERGPELWGGTKWSRRGTLCKVRQDAGETLAFAQQLSGRMHVETWAGGCKSLNLRISQEQEIKGRCTASAFPPRTPFVTPVFPGPGSDMRMMTVWKVKSKTEKSGVWFFPECRCL